MVVDDQRVEAGTADDDDRANAVRHLDARRERPMMSESVPPPIVDDVVAGAAVDLRPGRCRACSDGDVVDAVVAVDVERQDVLVRVGAGGR